MSRPAVEVELVEDEALLAAIDRIAQGDVRAMIILAEAVSAFNEAEVREEFLKVVRRVGLEGSAIPAFFKMVSNSVPEFSFLIASRSSRTAAMVRWARAEAGLPATFAATMN